MSKRINITIDAVGGVTADAVGFTGGACKVPLDSLKNHLGASHTEGENKAEFYESEHTGVEQTTGF